MASTQLDFNHLAAQEAPPRPASAGACAVAREEAQPVVEAAATGYSPAREAELERIRACLRQYIRHIGVGTQFQAVDFSAWMHRCGSPPDESIVSRTCTGGMFKSLVHRGVLEVVGLRNNAGNPSTGYESTPRSLYIVRRLCEEAA